MKETLSTVEASSFIFRPFAERNAMMPCRLDQNSHQVGCLCNKIAGNRLGEVNS